MNETIRDYIKRRVRWALVIGAGAWVALALTGLTGITNPAVAGLGFAVFFAAILAIQFIKCPRCATRLGQVAMLIGPLWSGKKSINFCPYCGVNLNELREPRRSSEAPVRAVNPIK
jgi:hypothetical protein